MRCELSWVQVPDCLFVSTEVVCLCGYIITSYFLSGESKKRQSGGFGVNVSYMADVCRVYQMEEGGVVLGLKGMAVLVLLEYRSACACSRVLDVCHAPLLPIPF